MKKNSNNFILLLIELQNQLKNPRITLSILYIVNKNNNNNNNNFYIVVAGLELGKESQKKVEKIKKNCLIKQLCFKIQIGQININLLHILSNLFIIFVRKTLA